MALDKPKILFVHYSDSRLTGGERMTLQLIAGMRKSEYTPVLLTQRLSPLAEAALGSGIATLIVPLPKLLDRYDGEVLRYSGLQKCRSVAHLIVYNYELSKLLRRERISAVWCSNIRALLTVGLTVRLMGIPLVWNIWLARQFGKWTQAVYDICYFLPTHIVTEYHGQSNALFRRLAGRSRPNISTVYTGIDVSSFKSARPAISIPTSRVHDSCELLTCCRVTPRKDLGCLLEAMAILSKRENNVRLTIAGSPFSDRDHAYYQKLLEKIARDGTGSFVRFAEWHDDVRPMLEAADVYVSSSSDEGLPGAVREAQAAGLPVVATDAGGTREAVLNGKTGLIVSCNDAQALADAIERLARDPILARQFGSAGRRRASELFSTEGFIQGYCAVFRRLLPRREERAA
jgi:glycosyltransferase involved in cell wall biosynthesis